MGEDGSMQSPEGGEAQGLAGGQEREWEKGMCQVYRMHKVASDKKRFAMLTE